MAVMRFDPFRDFDRLTEQLLSARGVRSMPMEAYRRATSSSSTSTCQG